MALEDEVRARYPQMAWALADADLKNLLMNAAANKWDQATLQAELHKTGWWQNTAAAQRNYQQLQGTDPAQAEMQLQAQVAHVADLAQQMGHDPHGNPGWTRHLAYQSLIYAWTDEQLNDALLGEMKGSGRPSGAGAFADTMAALEQMGANYFVPVSDDQARQWAYGIIGGGNTLANMETMFRDQARQWFPQFAEKLDQGDTMQSIYEPIKQTIAQLLEMNPATIDPINDRKWLTPLDMVDKDGNHRPMAMYEVQQWVRQMPEWGKTTQAREQVANVVQGLAETFGKVAR